MKKLLTLLILLTAVIARGQTFTGRTSLTAMTPSMGTSVFLIGSGAAYHQITWNVSGTVATCSVQVDSSVDGVVWVSGGTIGTQTCTTNGQSSVYNSVPNYVRVQFTAVSGGGSVTAVWYGYTAALSGGGSVTSVGLVGTTNQITVTGSSPITGSGSWTLSIPNPFTFPGKATGAASTTSAATFNIPTGAAPTGGNLHSGDLWNLSGILQFYDGTHTQNLATIQAAPTDQHLVKFSGVSGLLADAGAIPAALSGTQYGAAYFATTSTLSNLTAPTTKGSFNMQYVNPTDAATAPQAVQTGVTSREVGGTTNSDTILFTDEYVLYDGSVAVAVALPAPATLENTHYSVILHNRTTGTGTAVTVTPATWTIRGGSSIGIAQGQTCKIVVGAGTDWDAICAEAQMTAGTDVTLGRAGTGLTVGLTSATTTVNGQACTLGSTCSITAGANPAGTGTELQYRVNGTTLGAVAGSATSSGGAVVVSSLAARTHSAVVSSLTDASIVSPEWVQVVGNRAYLSSDPGGFTIVDITNPAAPVILGHYGSGTPTIFAADVVGNRAYLCGHDNSTFTILDITNPAAISVVGTLTSASLSDAEQVIVSGTHAFVSRQASNSITSVDISVPATPTIAQVLTDGTALQGAQQMALSGNYLYVPSPASNLLTVVDVTDPTAMFVATSLAITGAGAVTLSGTKAYVSSDGLLTIVDITTPTAPSVLGTLANSLQLSSAGGMDISGNLLYVTLFLSPGQITVVDVSDPARPFIVGTFTDPTIDTTETIQIVGNLGYVISGFGGGGANTLDVLDLQELLAASITGKAITFPPVATTAMGGAPLLAGACTTAATVTITGVRSNMAVIATPSADPGDGSYTKAYVSADDTVSVQVCEPVAATPNSVTYNVRVIQ